MSDPKTSPAELLRRAFDDAFARSTVERRQDAEPYLALRVAATPYAIAVRQIGGFAPARKIVPWASPLPAMLGITAVRGRLYPVYSIEALLAQSTNDEPRWLILCGGAEPVALSVAAFEGHVQVPSAARFAVGDDHKHLRHVQELVRIFDEVRGVIHVPSLLDAIKARVASGLTKEQ